MLDQNMEELKKFFFNHFSKDYLSYLLNKCKRSIKYDKKELKEIRYKRGCKDRIE